MWRLEESRGARACAARAMPAPLGSEAFDGTVEEACRYKRISL
jgi:hypothetical protein